MISVTFVRRSSRLFPWSRQVAILLLAFLTPFTPMNAATHTWDGGGGSDNWSDLGNWDAAGVPPSGNNTTVVFAGTTRLTPNQNIDLPASMNSMVFNPGAGAFVLGGNPIRFQTSSASVLPTIVQNSATPVTINNSILFQDTTTIRGTGSLTLAGPIIGGERTLTKIDSGTLTLAADNPATGFLNVNAGTLNIASTGVVSEHWIKVNGGTLNINGSLSTGSHAYFQMHGVTGGQARATLSSTGSLSSTESDIGGDATSDSLFTQNGGTHSVGGGLYLGVVAGGKGAYVLNGGTVTSSETTAGHNGFGTFRQMGGTHTATNGVVIARQNGSSGWYSLEGGTLSTNFIRGGNGTNSFNFDGGTLKPLGNRANMLENVDLVSVGNGGLHVDTNGYNIGITQNLVYLGSNTSTGAGLYKNGAGTLTLAGQTQLQSYSQINGGRVVIPNGASLSVPKVTGSIFIETFDLAGGTSLAVNGGTFTSGQLMRVGHTGTDMAQVELTGGSFGVDALSLGTTANSRARFAQTGGTVTLATGPGAGAFSIAEETGSRAEYFMNGPSAQLNARSLTVGNRGFGVFTQNAGTVTTNTNIILGLFQGGSAFYDMRGGALSTPQNLIVSNSNNTAIFKQTGGTVTASNTSIANNGGNSNAVYQLNGGTLTTTNVVHGPGAGDGYFEFNGGTLKARFNSSNFIQNLNRVVVRNGGAIIDTNGNNVTISQPLLHSDLGELETPVVVNGGSGYTSPPTVGLGSAPTGSVVDATATVADGKITSITLTGAANFTGPVIFSLTGGGGSGAFVAANFIPDEAIDGGLTKKGAGTLTLNGANTYTGDTIVTEGTFVLNGSIPRSLTVQSGATLKGTGSIGEFTNINAGGILSPGNGPGILTSDVFALSADSQTDIEIGGTARGTQYDSLDATSIIMGGTLNVTLTGGYQPAAGTVFQIFNSSEFNFEFQTINLPQLNAGLAWDARELETTGYLGVASLVADFDNDGDVDGRDFLVWQRGGSPNMLGEEDLELWRQQYGVGALVAPIAVPEPTSGILLAAMSLGLISSTRLCSRFCALRTE